MKRGSLEREIKLAVPDERALARVRAVSGGVARAPVQQYNRFFDSADFALRRAGFGVRLRDEISLDDEGRARWFLTLKGPRERDPSEPAFAVRREVEHEIDGATCRDIVEGRTDPLDELVARTTDADDLALIANVRGHLSGEVSFVGAFENERTRVDTVMIVDGIGVELVLELDRTLYPGGIMECEVELEIPNELEGAAATGALRSLLAIAGLRGAPARGKASRFFERLKEAQE